MANPLKKFLSLNPFTLSIITVLILAVLYIIGPRFLEVVELRALDIRFLIRGPIEPGPEVAIAVIDEKSVDELGRWPWPRSTIAKMIDVLSADGAKVVGFDVGFFEPDANTNLGLIKRVDNEINRLGIQNETLAEMLVKEREQADNDQILTKSISDSKSPIVLGYFFHMMRDESVAHIKPKEVQAKVDSVTNSHYTFVRLASPSLELADTNFTKAFVPESNIPELHEAADSAGYFNMFPDPDGTIRWVPMTIQCRDKFYMPLSIQSLRFFLGELPTSLTVTEIGIEKISVGEYDLPTDELGRLLVNFRGPGRTFPHYSISDIVNERLPKGTFKDRLVLVGATAVGIYDLRVTPFDSLFPGLEIHANVIDNILHQDFLVRPGWTAILDLTAIVLFGLLMGMALPRLSAITGPLMGIALGLMWAGLNYYLFTKGIWINIVYPILTLIASYTIVTVYRYMTEEREKKKIKGAFSYYVNPSVVSEMLKNPDMLKLGGDKRMMTVLFSDIRGFTTISEKMDPEALVHLLNQYLTSMTDIVFKYDGLLDKYIGDAIMAVWGAPLSQPDHARLACRTSLEMMAELETLRKTWADSGDDIPYLDIGIGLNSGPMVVGNMGSESRFDYTVMGDSVNLGSRLEGANKQYGTNIIIGEVTYEQIKDEMYCRELDSVAVKGKELPVRIYELIGTPGDAGEDKLTLARTFTRGVAAYKKQRWDDAERIFSAIHKRFPDDEPTRLYLERVAELKENPPPDDWDGVFVMKTK